MNIFDLRSVNVIHREAFVALLVHAQETTLSGLEREMDRNSAEHHFVREVSEEKFGCEDGFSKGEENCWLDAHSRAGVIVHNACRITDKDPHEVVSELEQELEMESATHRPVKFLREMYKRNSNQWS